MKAALVWIVILLGYGVLAWRLLPVTEGMGEDFLYVQAMSGETPPRIWQTRGLAYWSLWWQIHHGLTPRLMRLWNLRLAALVSLLVGLLAHRVHVSGVIATGVMLLHPLTIETVATMSGRFELIATLGIVIACLGVTLSWWPWRWSLIGLGLILSALGKEIAIVGVPIVAAVWSLTSSQARKWLLVAIVGVAIVSWTHRYAGTGGPGGAITSTWHWAGRQAIAAWRLMTLTILPIDQTPSPDLDRLGRLWAIVSGLGLVVWLVAAVAWLETRPVLTVGLLWMAFVCLPRVIVQTPGSYLNAHQWYLALVGAALAIAALAQTDDGLRVTRAA